ILRNSLGTRLGNRCKRRLRFFHSPFLDVKFLLMFSQILLHLQISNFRFQTIVEQLFPNADLLSEERESAAHFVDGSHCCLALSLLLGGLAIESSNLSSLLLCLVHEQLALCDYLAWRCAWRRRKTVDRVRRF